MRPFALVQAFPMLLFLVFLPPTPASPTTAGCEIRRLLAMAVVYVAVVCVTAPLALDDAPLGGAQWGPRFLMPLYPVLAAVIVFVFEQRAEWAAGRVWVPRLLAGVFAVLALASVAVQAQGIRDLRSAKVAYERLVRATEALDADGVIATDLWWYPTVIAAVLYDRQTMLVDVNGRGALPALLERLPEHGITSLILVSEGGRLGQRHAEALARSGWTETARQPVPMWLDVQVVSYRRDPPAPG
jgi:hypothetical protein